MPITHVTSLELSRRLKELGVPQKSLFYWTDGMRYDGNYDLVYLHAPLVKEGGSVINTVSAYLASELGELLPKKISVEALNKRFPFVTNREAEQSDEEMDATEDKIMDDFKSVFNELYDHDGYEDGFAYSIGLGYGQGKKLYYYFNSEEWECCYQVFEIEGDTEANARAKCLIYLLENHLISVEELGK